MKIKKLLNAIDIQDKLNEKFFEDLNSSEKLYNFFLYFGENDILNNVLEKYHTKIFWDFTTEFTPLQWTNLYKYWKILSKYL